MLAGAAWLVRIPLDAQLGGQYEFITFFPATAVAAFLLGFWPGIICTVASAALIVLLVASPQGQPMVATTETLVGLLFFLATGVLLSGIGALGGRSRRVDAALMRAQAHLRLVTDEAPALISYIDKDLRYRLANQRYETWFGLRREDVIGRSMEEVLGPEAVARLQPYIQRVLAGEDVHFEVEAPYRTGGIRWIDAHYVPDVAPRRGVRGFFVLVLDITERKRIEAELSQKRALLEASFNNAGVGKTMCDVTANRFQRVNRRFCELVGYSEIELASMTPLDLAHRDEPPGVLDRYRPLMSGEIDALEVDHCYRHKDGHKVWAHVNVVLIRDSAGRPQFTYAIIQDETARRNAEIALRESEARFRTLANAMPQLIWTAEPDGRVDYYNEKVTAFDGFTFDEGSGKWDWKPCLHPDDALATAEAWQHAVRTGEEYLVEHRVRMAHARDGRQGEYRWYLSRAISVKDSRGQIIKWYGTATDIQALKQSEEALRRANDDLLQFASIASHDLKEPLRGMSLLASFIQSDDGPRLSPESQQKLARLRGLADRLTQMVSGLLDHARTGLNPQRTTCDLTAIVQQIIDNSREDHAARGCEVLLRGQLPVVLADPMLMERIFANLIANGLKFNDSEVKRVEISADDLTISVRDNGIGIDPSHQEKIFRIFRRAHGDGRYPGEGLGLAIVRRIIEAHGGTISVESSPGEGSTFRIHLPLNSTGRGKQVAQAREGPDARDVDTRDDANSPVVRTVISPALDGVER